MPFTFNGIGTTLYGKREFRPDGSYITTEWFVGIYIPLWPLESMRIVPTGKNKYYGVYRSSGYVVLERTKLNVRQVLSVYGWFAVVFGSIWVGGTLDVEWFAILCLMTCILTLGAPWFLRRRAINRMVEEFKRTSMGLSPSTTD